MSKDTIYREDAIDAIECVTWYHQNRNKDMVNGANSDEHQAWYKAEDIYDALEAVPSADRWIPCSERLPSNSDDVLITIKGNDFVSSGAYAGYYSNRWWYMCEDGEVTDVPILADVLAWMPLPKPWKGADDD